MTIPGISLTEADGQVFLRGQPSTDRAPLDAAALRTWLVDSGYGNCLLLDDAIAAAAHDCNTKQSPFVVQVAEKRDARIDVHVAPDAMAAHISLTPPQGGKAADIEDIIRALTEAGVIYGIDQAALLQACEVGHVEQLPVACGAAAQDGTDAQFEELVPQTVDRAPKLNADGLIDYREHSGISLVEPGAPLMRRIPATPGVEGYSVRGHPMEPRPGRDEPFTTGLIGAGVSAEDPNVLCAAITGQPVRVACGVNVEPVLRVAEVNLATGNIYFDGSVQITGEVIQGMKVQAKGDIEVGGTVDGGLLEATGNILVKGGIIANAQVVAGGSVTARFATGSSLSAGTVLALDDMALECDLRSQNQILIGTKAPQRGKLVAGTATAAMLIKAPVIGSSKSATTRVSVGSNPALELEVRTLQERMDKEKANEDNLKKLINHLTAVGDPKGMLEKVKASWRQALQVWGKSLAERGELDKLLAHARNARVELGLGTSGPVELQMGSRKINLRKEYGAGAFSTDKTTQTVFTDPSGHATPVN